MIYGDLVPTVSVLGLKWACCCRLFTLTFLLVVFGSKDGDGHGRILPQTLNPSSLPLLLTVTGMKGNSERNTSLR